MGDSALQVDRGGLDPPLHRRRRRRIHRPLHVRTIPTLASCFSSSLSIGASRGRNAVGWGAQEVGVVGHARAHIRTTDASPAPAHSTSTRVSTVRPRALPTRLCKLSAHAHLPCELIGASWGESGPLLSTSGSVPRSAFAPRSPRS